MIKIKRGIYILKIHSNKITLLDCIGITNITDFRNMTSDKLGGGKSLLLRCLVNLLFVSKQTTATVDLNLSMEELLANMNSNTRNEVRRADKILIETRIFEDKDLFVSLYNSFAKLKGLQQINIVKLDEYKENLVMTAAYKDGEVLCCHAYIMDIEDDSVSLLYSCSPRLQENINANLISWGNRYLHYKDFELFKQKGLSKFEWSGVCMDSGNAAEYGIGRFKLGLGGELREAINIQSPLMYLACKIKSLFH